MYWSSLAGLGNYDDFFCSGHLQLDMATMARGHLFLFENVVAEEVQLVVGVYFKSCHASALVIFSMYMTQKPEF